MAMEGGDAPTEGCGYYFQEFIRPVTHFKGGFISITTNWPNHPCFYFYGQSLRLLDKVMQPVRSCRLMHSNQDVICDSATPLPPSHHSTMRSGEEMSI